MTDNEVDRALRQANPVPEQSLENWGRAHLDLLPFDGGRSLPPTAVRATPTHSSRLSGGFTRLLITGIAVIILGLPALFIPRGEPVGEADQGHVSATGPDSSGSTNPAKIETSTTSGIPQDQGPGEPVQVLTENLQGIEVVTLRSVGSGTPAPSRGEAVFVGTVQRSETGDSFCISRAVGNYRPAPTEPTALTCEPAFLLEGLEFDNWTQVVDGVSSAEVTLTVRWPIVNKTAVVTHVDSPIALPTDQPQLETPEECSNTVTNAPDAMNQYADDIGPESGGLYVSADGVLVFQVTRDAERHLSVLADMGVEACVIEVAHSVDQLEHWAIAWSDEIERFYPGASVDPSPPIGGRIEILLPVADSQALEQLLEIVEPSAVRVVGLSILAN